MDGNKSYKVGEEIYEIPEGGSESFLKDFPKAVEIQSFIADKDTFDIPIEEVKDFQKEFPSATPLKKKETLEPKQKEFYTPPTTLQEQIASPFGEKPKESVSEAPSTPSEQLKPVGGLEYKFQTEQPGQRIPGSKAFDTRTIQEVRDSGEKPTMDNYIYSAVNHLEQFGMEGVEGIKSGYEKIKKGAEIFKEGQDVVLQETAKTIVAPYIGERGDFSKIGEGLTKQAQGYVKMIAGTGETGLSAVMHFTPSGAVVTEGIKAVELIPGVSNVTKFLFAPVSSFAELKVEEVARQSGVDPEELKQEVISGTTADLLQIGDFIGAALFLKGGHEGYKGIREKIKQGVDLTPQEMNEAISASLDVVKDPDLLQKASDLSGLKIKTGAQMDAEIKANKESLPENKVISAIEKKIKGEDSQKELASTNVDKETFDTVVNLAKTTDQITENQATELTNEFDNVQKAKGSTPEEHQNNPEIITLVAEKNKLQDQKKGLDESFHPEINAKIDEIKKKIQGITTPKTPEIKPTEGAIIPEKTKLTPEEISTLTPEQKDDYEFAVESGDTEAIKTIISEIKTRAPKSEVTHGEISQEETIKEMMPITDEMAKAELEFDKNGFEIRTDYDNEIIILDKKTGEQVEDISQIPEELHGLARDYELATQKLGDYDAAAREIALKKSRGEEVPYQEITPKQIAPKPSHPQTVEFISEGFPYKEGKEPIPKRKTLDKVYQQEHIDFTNEMIDTGLFNSVGEILTWRPDLGISTVEVKAGIKAIKEGRNTAPARKLIEASKEIMDKGEISMIIGSGGMMDKMGVTLDDWRESVKDMPMPTELTEEQAKQAENLPQNVIDIISKEGITKENFVSLQDELKGWYSEKELNQIKTYFDETTGSKTTGAARTGATKVEGKPLGEAKGKGKTRPTEEELVKKLEAQKKKITDRIKEEENNLKNKIQKLSETEGPSYGITQFNPNEVAEKKSKIKTKKGEEIPLTSLSQQGSFDFAGESFVQQEANKAVGYSSELKPDENIWMERLLSEHPNISLTAGTKIKTSADVAYLFRHLEDAVSENVFAVLKKKDGSYDVLYLGTGGTTGAVVDIKFIYTAAKDRGAESVYIVHNHPSGNLKPSAADIDLHTRLKDLFEEGGIKVNEGIIINLDSGDYTVFSKEHDLRKERPKAMPGETSVKTYHFEKQRLYAPSAERTKIFGSEDIAVFLSQQKRGLVPKNGIIILDRANTINRYLLEGELTKQELIDKILENVGRHGESVILVTNGKFDVKMINEVGALLKKGDIQLLDAIETTDSPDIRRNYKSLADEGFLREPEKSYGKESTAGEAKAIKEYDAAISDFDQKIINAKKSKQNKLNQFSKRVDLFGAEAKTNELFGAEQDLSKENIDKQMQPYNDEIKKLEKEKSDFIDNKERFLKKYEGQTEIGIKAESAKKRITEIGEKIKKLPGVTGPEGLTKAGISPDMAKLIDVTVKTIHKLIDAGVEIGEAIDRAIATMKRSGIYKRLSGEKDFNIDEFDNQIRTEFEKEKPENRIIQEEAEKASEQTGLNPAKIDKAVKEQKRKTVEEARGFIKKRRAAIDSENFKTAIYTHGLEKELTKEQREVLPFIIEGTSVPEKLGRPDLEKVYESDKEKLQKYADDVKKHFDDMWQKIVENTDNLSNEQIKDYVTHIWDIPKSKIDGVVSWFSTKNRFLKKRYIATLEEGINTFGLKPKVLDIADIIKIHDSVANTVIANSEFVKDLKTLERDGVPLMVRSDKAPEGWVTIDHPSLTAPLFIPGETPTIVRLPYKVHPDLAGPLKAIFDKKIDHPVFKAWTALDSVMKKIALSISLFHHGALTETAIPQMGIYKTGKTIIKDAILKAIRDKADSTPLLDYPEETLDAINHGVKFGHTLDIDTGRIKTMLGKVAEKTKDAPVLKRITGFLDSFNDKWDNVLWNYLHDGLKLQAFMDAKAKMPENVKNPKVYLEEQAQLINDYFGGQNWDNLLVSPKTQQLLSVFLLSPDWTISKLRLAGAPFGIGKLSKEGRFARAKTSGMFWFKSAMYYGIGINLLNAYYRSQDEKEHPEYYPKGGTDFMDKTMFGNTIGHKTHLFTGRYEDGSEKYLRWGKEFREVPELFMDEEGISFPRPLLKKIGGKMSPMMQLSSQLLTGKTLSGYENWDLKDKKGWDWTLGAMKLIGKSFLPFSSGNFFRDDKQWSPSDLMFPSSKGMSNSAAIGLFKKGIEARDEAYVKEIYENAVRNNLDAYGLFKIALQTIKAEKTRELTGDVKTIQDINQKLKTATIEEKIKLSRKKQKLIIKKQNTDRANLLYNEALAKMREFEATKR